MGLKFLYTFEAEKEVLETVSEERDGGVFTKEVKVKKPIKFGLRKPNRALIDDADLFYSIQLSEAVKVGLLPRALLAKRINNDSGIFSDAQLEEQNRLYTRLLELNNEITRYSAKEEAERTAEDKKSIDKTIEEYTTIQRRLSDYENFQNTLFENTAENRARLRAILWYSLFLSYIENDKGEFVPLYEGATFKDKLASYDKIEEEENTFLTTVSSKFNYFATALYMGRCSTMEDFKRLDEQLSSTFGSALEPEVKPEPAPAEVPVIEAPIETPEPA